jgi:hypothetical protein
MKEVGKKNQGSTKDCRSISNNNNDNNNNNNNILRLFSNQGNIFLKVDKFIMLLDTVQTA